VINRRPLRRGGLVSEKTAIIELLDGLTLIAARAAAAILAVPRDNLNQRAKADSSPVTAADEAAERLIRDSLTALRPDIPVVSEETTGNRVVENLGRRFFLVDPLDGTREFLAGLDEFTVNIALIDEATPVLGVVAAPARGLVWRGQAGHGAERLTLAGGDRISIQTRVPPASGARVVISRSHLDPATDAYLDRLSQPERIACGSSLKFCRVAEGTADLYPRLGPTSEWDIAAGHAVLVAAGGQIRQPDGRALRYGQHEFRVPGFIASGNPQLG
jgi:3'(2'), 5'-bisphosphate nucleotidase